MQKHDKFHENRTILAMPDGRSAQSQRSDKPSFVEVGKLNVGSPPIALVHDHRPECQQRVVSASSPLSDAVIGIRMRGGLACLY